MQMDEKDRIAEQIKQLIASAEKKKGLEFRKRLEEIVEDGDEDAEYAVIHYLGEADLKYEIRSEIIRVAGYLQRPAFLVPLKKIIDSEPNHRIQQEAIIAISKFNDRRALNVLNGALQKVKDPILQRVINTEISRIKENNPLLALIPRFQEGRKNQKVFKVTLDILKRILTPADTGIFAKFLGSKDPLVQNGAFEILCLAGDIFHDSEILGYYEARVKKIPCLRDKDCYDLYMLTYHLRQYISRYQFMIEEQIPNLQALYKIVNDQRVKELLLAMICKSQDRKNIPFIEEVYQQEEKVRETIIRELSGIDIASDFLFAQYETDPSLKETIIESLLNIKKGLDYFVEHFFTLTFEDQEIIANKLPYAGEHDLVDFIKQIFQSDIYRLKEILLAKVRENYEFTVKELLFDPDKQREFQFMGDKYLDTITQLFPVTSIKKLLAKIAKQDLSVKRTKKYLGLVEQLVERDLIINFPDKEFLAELFEKIVRTNNLELNILFLGLLKNFRTLSAQTQRNLRDTLGLFITRRQTNLKPQEQGELTRIKRRFKDVFFEIARIEEGHNLMKRMSGMEEIDFDMLFELVKRNHLSVVLYKDEFVQFLTGEFEKANRGNLDQWIEFLKKFPNVANLLKPAIEERVEGSNMVYEALADLCDSLAEEPPRIALNFHKRQFTAIFREQFQEALPDFPVIINAKKFRPNDILICDPEVMRDLTLLSVSLPDKVYILIPKGGGYGDFRAYNTTNFFEPFSFYRIVKEILQKLYL